MSDNISRQAALDIFDDFEVGIENGMNEYEFKRKELLDLPSTDRKGHWKIYDHVDRIGRVIGEKICVCDQCKETMTLSWRAKVPNFCQHCGADMRGEQND